MPVEIFLEKANAEQEYETIDEADLKDDDVVVERIHEEAKTEEVENEDGTKEEYDDYFYMNGEEIKLDPLSQEQVERIVGFILSVDKCYYYNESIMNIINEEMDAFYTGQKTAQEVAKTIQNRAQLYVDENR